MTVIRLLINYTGQSESPEPVTVLLKTKNDVMSEFGGSDRLEVEMKTQILLRLLDSSPEDEEASFRHLTELMRWLTFSTSSVQMIFFNEEVIPILIEMEGKVRLLII